MWSFVVGIITLSLKVFAWAKPNSLKQIFKGRNQMKIAYTLPDVHSSDIVKFGILN